MNRLIDHLRTLIFAVVTAAILYTLFLLFFGERATKPHAYSIAGTSAQVETDISSGTSLPIQKTVVEERHNESIDSYKTEGADYWSIVSKKKQRQEASSSTSEENDVSLNTASLVESPIESQTESAFLFPTLSEGKETDISVNSVPESVESAQTDLALDSEKNDEFPLDNDWFAKSDSPVEQELPSIENSLDTVLTNDPTLVSPSTAAEETSLAVVDNTAIQEDAFQAPQNLAIAETEVTPIPEKTVNEDLLADIPSFDTFVEEVSVAPEQKIESIAAENETEGFFAENVNTEPRINTRSSAKEFSAAPLVDAMKEKADAVQDLLDDLARSEETPVENESTAIANDEPSVSEETAVETTVIASSNNAAPLPSTEENSPSDIGLAVANPDPMAIETSSTDLNHSTEMPSNTEGTSVESLNAQGNLFARPSLEKENAASADEISTEDDVVVSNAEQSLSTEMPSDTEGTSVESLNAEGNRFARPSLEKENAASTDEISTEDDVVVSNAEQSLSTESSNPISEETKKAIISSKEDFVSVSNTTSKGTTVGAPTDSQANLFARPVLEKENAASAGEISTEDDVVAADTTAQDVAVQRPVTEMPAPEKEEVLSTDKMEEVVQNVETEVAQPTPLPAAENQAEENVVAEEAVDKENELWYIDSGKGEIAPEELWIYRMKDRKYNPSSIDEFVKMSQPDVATVVVIHGNLADPALVIQHAFSVKNRLDAIQKEKGIPTRYRLVIWKWASERTLNGIRYDSQFKAQLADKNGLALGAFLSALPKQHSVTLIGFSFGARTIGSALTYLSGGQVTGMALPKEYVERNQLTEANVFLLGAATDYGDFSVHGKYGVGLSKIGNLVNAYNSSDKALKFYPMMYHNYHPIAQGTMELPTPTQRLVNHTWSADASVYGVEHNFDNYLYSTGSTLGLAFQAL